MELSPGLVGTLLLISILLSGGALIAGIMAVQAQRKVRATYGRFARGRREDVVTLLEMHMDEVKRLQQMVRSQQAYSKQLRGVLSRSLSRIGTVRYDAFDDMGGRLSFSIALLDEHGDGSVITAMNGRVQTRTYAKPISGGSSNHNLSEEEVQAIAQAMDAGAVRAAEIATALPAGDGPDHLATEVDEAAAPGHRGESGPDGFVDDSAVPHPAVGDPAVGDPAVGEPAVGDMATGDAGDLAGDLAVPTVSASPAGEPDPSADGVTEPAVARGAGLTPRPRRSDPVVPMDYNPTDRPPPGSGAAGRLPAVDALPSTGVAVDQASQARQAGS